MVQGQQLEILDMPKSNFTTITFSLSFCCFIFIFFYLPFFLSERRYSFYRDPAADKYIFNTPGLLTLFTTFKDIPERYFIHYNTVLNWASLGDAIKPLFFNNLTEPISVLLQFALKNGWTGLPVQGANGFGTPFLKGMYRKAYSISPSKFYGFCNADILFDKTLNQTLSHIANNKNFNTKTVLVIGRRTNVDVNEMYEMYNSSAAHNSSLLAGIAKAKGQLFIPQAEDYFFLLKPEEFPWHYIKDVVIGRPAYDNYFVGKALQNGVAVIDATETLLAFHQTGEDGNFAGQRNKDSMYNRMIIGHFIYATGYTSAAKYYTQFDFNGEIIVRKSYDMAIVQ